ncbi:MAG: hypothetical protein M9890_04250 [Thermomicrobiales bacterium]|nr:hypothetical protein [Thermomicrobiales bacterium]
MRLTKSMMRAAVSAVTLSLILSIVFAGVASAHAHVHVGDYELTVGFTGEPALVNQPNGLDLRVAKGEGESATPVEGLEETLKAEISVAGQTMQLPLRGVWNTPGSYTSDIIPTEVGAYTIRIYGTIEGTDVDESITAGPDTFSEIESTDDISFPAVASSASDDGDSDSSQTLAIAGLIAGLLGLAAGGFALMRSRPASANSASATTDEDM